MQRGLEMKSYFFLGVALMGSAAAADAPIKKSMSFDACLELIRATAQRTGEAPTNIIETKSLRVVRFPAQDGSLLVTCNGDAKTLTMQPSSKRCGKDVVC